MDQKDKMRYGVWDLSRLKSSQSSKNHQSTDGFAAYVSDRNHLAMSASNSGASKFQEYPLMDGVIDMSSKVSSMNKVSVIKNSAEQSQKFSPMKQTPTKNYTRTREKAENARSRLSPEGVAQNKSGDLQFKIFGSEMVRKETSHLVNNSSPEKSHGHSQAGHFIQQNLNCRPANNHSRQQNSVFPDQARTYQKCSSKVASESELVHHNFDHHKNHIWNPAKDLSTESVESRKHDDRFSKNSPRGLNNGPTTPLLLSTVRSDVAMDSNDTKVRLQATSAADDDVQEVYSISDDSQGRVEMRVDMVEENAEVYPRSLQEEGSAKSRTKRTFLVRDSDPNEEVYFICEDGDDEVEMVDEDEEEEEAGEADGNEEDERQDDEEEETNNGGFSTAEESCQNGEVTIYRDDRDKEEYEDDLSGRRKRGSAVEFSSPARSRPRRGRRPRNSLVLSQSRLSAKQEQDADSEDGSLRFSSPGRRRGRGRGARRGWSTRGGRGASASKRARPMKRSSSLRTVADTEEDSKKAKKPRIGNMFIADKISSAVAAAASATQSNQVMEYQWPKGKNGEWHVLQEHVSEFLGVVSFKRKYPDISRRPVEYQERQFLCEQGCVTEMQCDLGLTALKAEEVLDLMARDYPEKYQEYLRVARKKLKVAEKPAEKSSSEGTSKAESLLKRAMKSTMDFNSALLRERRSERQTYFDLQTLEIHQPIRRPSVKYSSTKLCNSFPVAVVPGQFQEYYKSYTPEELKYFPINTALYAPHKFVQSIYADPVETVSDEEEDRTAANNNNTNKSTVQNTTSSLSASKQGRPRTSILNRFPALEKSEIDLNGSDSNLSFSSAKKAKRGGATPGKPKKPVAPQVKCGMCNQTNRNKYNEADELVRCNSCAVSNHPGCLGLSQEMVPVIRTYNWQCMECKTCFKCTEPHDEDKMMFCDHCDRGYHTYCVGVVSIPEGRWDCSMCIGKSSNLRRDSSLPSDFGSPSAPSAKAKLAETLAARPKPKRGRPFKYPRDENNVRIVTAQQTPTKSASTADGDDPSRAKVDQSKTSTFTNISNQIAASNESADSNPALPPGPDQRSAGTFSTGGRASVPSTFSKLQRQQGPINLIEEGPSI